MKLQRFLLFLALSTGSAVAQDEGSGFEGASGDLEARLESSIAELNALTERVADEKIPLNQRLNELEGELAALRVEYQDTVRLLDGRSLDVTNLGKEIKTRKEEVSYLRNLLGDYTREFKSRLHIAEDARFQDVFEAASLAPENDNLSDEEVFSAQAELVSHSIERLNEALGGARFEGQAVGEDGLVKDGTFLVVGPVALFCSSDGMNVGVAEERVGSAEPTQLVFANEADRREAAGLVSSSEGLFPLDPTLGNAYKIEGTQETFVEHVKKGGPLMWPIFIMAGLALLIALYKWLRLSFVRKPARREVAALLDAVAKGDEPGAQQAASRMRGPTGEMLRAGVAHLREPRELIEEIMYETVLKTRLKLQGLLPFIAICAASAPLLGLLGTVTGIINTFKMITVFGSGDVKSLSGGISEALITTKFGLIIAIPSLLLHAFLSRKAKRITSNMELAGVAFVNQASKSGGSDVGGSSGPAFGADPQLQPFQTPSADLASPEPAQANGHQRKDGERREIPLGAGS